MKKYHYILFFFFFTGFLLAQHSIETFLKPSDTLYRNRLTTLVISETAIGAGTLIGLNQVWYADYPHSNFHFINDNADWLQIDKMGHFFSTYHLGRFGANALQWSGASKKSQLLYGSTLGLAFLTTVEVFDGYSANWGASMGDVMANVSGTALYVSQQLLWNEQRIVPTFSFHTPLMPLEDLLFWVVLCQSKSLRIIMDKPIGCRPIFTPLLSYLRFRNG